MLYYHADEPNNKNGNENCLELKSNSSWTWNDLSCDRKNPFICERHGNVNMNDNISLSLKYRDINIVFRQIKEDDVSQNYFSFLELI